MAVFMHMHNTMSRHVSSLERNRDAPDDVKNQTE